VERDEWQYMTVAGSMRVMGLDGWQGIAELDLNQCIPPCNDSVQRI
jgi:hypothetical protein